MITYLITKKKSKVIYVYQVEKIQNELVRTFRNWYLNQIFEFFDIFGLFS